METKKLEDAILEIISKIFENNGKELTSYEKIKSLSKKCVEIASRQANFIVQESFSDGSAEIVDLNSSSLVKKHLQKIDNTLNNYFSNQEFLDNALSQNLNPKNDPKILEKLMQKLESIKDYQPDFILNIRDISLDAWKDTAEFEKILNNERKKFENFVMKLDNKWRNRVEFLKQKTAEKIEKLEVFIKKISFEANLAGERLLMKIEDLCSIMIRQSTEFADLTNTIKKSGYKDLKGIIKNISKFEGMKAKLQGQNEAAQKELKNIKTKMSAAINKQEEFKKKFENSEELLKELEKNFLKMMELSNFNANEKKNIEALLTEKKFGVINDLLKNREDKHLKNNSTVLTRNEYESNSFTTRKNSKSSLNPQIHKTPSKNNVEETFLSQTEILDSEKIEENPVPTTNSLNKIQKSLNNENPAKKNFENIKESPNLKNDKSGTKKILKKENLSLKKKLNTETTDSKPSQNNIIKTDSKQKYLSEAFPNKKEFETPQNEKIGLNNKNKFTSKHRKSLEPQPLIEKEEISLAQSQKSSFFQKIEDHSISSSIKKIFASYVTKMWKQSEFSKGNNEDSQVINEMNTEELLRYQIKINGEVKTLQEIFLENIENSLKTEKNSVLWENIFSTKKNQKSDSIIEMKQSSPYFFNKPEENSKNFEIKGWRKLTLSLFVLLESYLEVLENNHNLSIQELLKENLDNKDCIMTHILTSKNPENELKEISLVMNRNAKYELLYKIHKIHKNIPFAEWKSEKVHIINKIRWGNLINKLKNLIENPSNLIKNIAAEIKHNKPDFSVVETTETIKKTRHNHSVENINLNDLKTIHQRNVSLNHRGLNYFLPQIQKTPRFSDQKSGIPSFPPDFWIKNSNKKL